MPQLTENACDVGAMKEAPEGRDPVTGRWLPGFGGGGGHLKRGKRHQASALAQALIDGEAEEIIRGVIEDAKKGDPVCRRLVVERLAPVRKSAPIRFELPPVETLDDARRAAALILAGHAEGELTVDEARGLMDLLAVNVEFASLADLEARIAKIEAGAS